MSGPGSMHCSERARRTRLLRSVSLLLAFVSDFRCHKMAHIPPVTTVVFQAGRIQKKLKIKGRTDYQQALFHQLSVPLSYWLVLTHCCLSLFLIG